MKSWYVAALVTLASLPALACSCAPVGPGAPEADTIIEGRVAGIYPDSGGKPEILATIAVTRILKGSAGPRALVRTASSSAACGVSFQVGQTVHVALRRAARGYTTNLCLNQRDQTARQPKT